MAVEAAVTGHDEQVRLWTQVTQAGSTVVLKLRGELSPTTAPAVRSLLANLFDAGDRSFVIDLSDMLGATELDLPAWVQRHDPEVRVLLPRSA